MGPQSSPSVQLFLSSVLSCKFYLPCTLSIVSSTPGAHQAPAGSPSPPVAWTLSEGSEPGQSQRWSYLFPISKDHCAALSGMPCPANGCFIYFVWFWVVLAGRVSPIPVTSSWLEGSPLGFGGPIL